MSRTPAVKKGAVLQAEIAKTKLREGEAALWWLGQATFCFKIGEAVVYFDPFYRAEGQKPDTLQEMPLRPDEMTGASLICCSHDHLDHTDPLTLPGAAKASPQAPILLPHLARDVARKAGIPLKRMRVMRGDDAYTADGLHVTALPSAHMGVEYDLEAGHRYLGYVLQGNDVTIYHPGDTQPYVGWRERIDRFTLDVALLPINGNDNLFYPQAVYFCANHRPRVAVPIHYGMFAGNTEDPKKFTDLMAKNVPDQQVKVLRVGERYIYRR
ncbi:MAG: MBL fold metallo-hydrolase [Candidatus Latescibacteria bacterium]|nr:MBL fold metallo-hydrolase [Candidatus Latescibacterota bacterium]